MVHLNRIYTRTGDAGTTKLGDGSTAAKFDERVEAYGLVDEANSSIGVALAMIGRTAETEDRRLLAIHRALLRAQNDLFDVGADLCVPIGEGDTALRVTQSQIDWAEHSIDGHNERLEPLRSFVLPSGTELAARLHVARTVVRRAERGVARLIDGQGPSTNPLTLVYLNRLSDLLFVLARVANDDGRGDHLWAPGENREG